MATTSAPCPAPAETGPRPTFAQLYTSARSYLLPRRRYFFSVAPADIEDLVHDTVVVAHRALDRYQPPPGVKPEIALGRWLFGIAWRLAARQASRLALGRALPSLPSAPEPDPEALAINAEERRLLVRILRAIQGGRARALILHERDDRSAPEIAKILGIKENTVKSRIRRGLHDARRAMRLLKPGELLLLQQAVGR